MLHTAMIVDDNKEMRETLKSVLSGLVTVVDECEDGDEVLTHYRHTRPDIILMDIAMKRMDGLRAMKELLLEYPNARVVVISQYDGDEIREEAKKSGSIGFVHKEQLSLIHRFVQ